MTEKFHTELAILKQDTLEMARFAQDMLKESIVILMNEDVTRDADVKNNTKRIRELTASLEDRAYQLIALNQPMAKDMRTIVCTLKIISAAERIGRYGKGISYMAKQVQNQPEVSQPGLIPHMADQVTGMIDDVISSYGDGDLARISDLSLREDTVDMLWHSFFREMLTFMMENPATINRCTNYIMVARYLERCGDHACKMAENVHFMVTGERIEV
jgi:phosphate transport system protein